MATPAAMAMRTVGGHAASGDHLIVMTYNVLAQCYVRSSFFPYCAPSVLRWKNRSKCLEEVFSKELTVKPHIVCLQEVDNFDEFWARTMRNLGYQGMYVQKVRKKDGVAIFWQEDAVSLVQHQTVSLDVPVGDEAGCNDDLLSRTVRGSVGLMIEFAKSRNPTQRFVVATTHLFWDPLQEDVKLLQTQRMLRTIDAFMDSRPLPLIFAGDFNSMPDSEVYRFITETHGYRSAYASYKTPAGEPDFTNVNGVRIDLTDKEVPNFIGTLDYIFFKSHRLHPAALREMMPLELAVQERSLPSTFSPSDHLPLLCDFVLQHPPNE
ncbi:hypothetical protein PINS_up015443 [Pythium insidiosum]|nr:hypothetical protein PINS_up015443 [Pythium insidiosum]